MRGGGVGDTFAGLDCLDRLGDRVGGDREANTRASRLGAAYAGGITCDLGVDAEHVAFFIQQRSARVPRIEGGVGLDRPGDLGAVRCGYFATEGRHYASGERLFKAVGVTDRVHRVAHLQRARADQFQRLQAETTWIYANERKVTVGFFADERCRSRVTRGATGVHSQAARALDDMTVCKDQAFFVEHDSGPAVLALRFHSLDRHHARRVLLVDLGGGEPGRSDLTASGRRDRLRDGRGARRWGGVASANAWEEHRGARRYASEQRCKQHWYE